jgi:hypothetical protein
MGKEWMTAQVSYFNDYSSQQQSQRKVLSRWIKYQQVISRITKHKNKDS